MKYFWITLFSTLLFSACTTVPKTPSEPNLDKILYSAELEGIRWGILVTDISGTVLLERNADQRFSPASNTKLATTAAAFHWMEVLRTMSLGLSTRVVLDPSNTPGQKPDLILIGRGDPEIQSGPDCEVRCLEFLADQILQSGISQFNNIIADESWFAAENWAPGWSWEDLQAHYGTAVSALGVNKNIAYLNIRPSVNLGQPIETSWGPNGAAFKIQNNAKTASPENAVKIRADRLPGSATVRLSGEMPKSGSRKVIRLGLDRPAKYAGQLLEKRLLERGATVSGTVNVIEGERVNTDKNTSSANCVPSSVSEFADEPQIIAKLPAPDWQSVLSTVNKDSQNLYAEMVLRQLGKICGDGTTEAGLTRVNQLLTEAGAPPNGYDFFDGSGMSVYNRVSPRTLVKLLVYADNQNWGQDWRQTFPIGGVDRGLRRRFDGTPLDGKIFAKTGTLKGVNALSGYMISAKGKELAFSIIANDRPLDLATATPFMDRALIEIAEHL